MKKLLLSLATLLCGAGAWGQRVTDLPELSTAENPVYYVMHNTRSEGGLIYFDGTTIKDNNPTVLTDAYKFYFTGEDYEHVKIHNVAAGNKMLVNHETWNETGSECTIAVTPHSSNAGLSIRFAYTNENYKDFLNELNQGRDGYTEWSANDDGSIFVIEKVEDVAMPEVGKEYIITPPLFTNVQCSIKGIYDDNGTAKWHSVSLSNDNDIWIVGTTSDGKITLKNKGTGKYLNGTGGGNTANGTQDDEIGATISYLARGQYNITISGGNPLHAAGHNSGNGADGNVVKWAGGLNSASAWKFVKANANEFAVAFYDKSPVKITTDDSDKKYFAIKSGRGDAYWYTLTDDNKIHLNEFTGADNQLWYLKATMNEAGDKAYVQLFPKNGDGKAMSYQNSNNAADKIVGQVLGTDGWSNTWKLIYVDGIGHCRMQTSDEANYLSNNGGVGNNMGMWSGSPESDTGTQMYIYDVNGALQEIYSQVAYVREKTSYDICDYFEPFTAELTAAMEKANGCHSQNTVQEIILAWFELQNASSTEVQNQLQPGFYRIYNNADNAYMLSGTGTGRVLFKKKTNDENVNGVNSIFYYDGEKLVSYENGLFIQKANGDKLSYAAATNVGGGEPIYFVHKLSMDGKCYIKFHADNRYFHCAAGNDTDETIETDAGNGSDPGVGPYWFTIQPVQWLPVMKPASNNGYATIFSPVALALKSNLEAYVAESTENGRVQMTSVDVVPANTGVILKSYEGVETDADNGYVYLQIVSNTDAPESKLKGTLADEYIIPEADTKCYVLATPTDKETAFYKAALNQNQQGNSAFVNNGFKAYLPVANGTAPARFLFDFGTETGIEDINGAETETNAVIYDLSGRRVQNAQKGIYIINGKKVIK